MENIRNGIYIGKDSAVAIANGISITFLRLREDLIVSILYHGVHGIVAVVYGHGKNFDASAEYCMKIPDTGEIRVSDGKCGSYLDDHARDRVEMRGNMLVYVMHDGHEFENELAEPIDMESYIREYPKDGYDSLAEKMAIWEQRIFFEYNGDQVHVGIDTKKYSVYYNFSFDRKCVYCRLGKNGYCERGRAMLSTICIRQNECRMIEDNRDSLGDYVPDESCFADGTCTFPADGGWYWSLSRVTDDVIYLNGCGGVTYEIHRVHGWMQ